MVLTMPFEKLTEKAVAHLISRAKNADSAVQASRCHAWAATLLDWNKQCIPTFCNRYIKESRDEYELGTALSIASRLESDHRSRVETACWLLKADKVFVHFKHDACLIFAKNSDSLETGEIKRVLKGLSTTLAVSLSGKLIMAIDRFRPERRLEILRMALEISNVDDKDERRFI